MQDPLMTWSLFVTLIIVPVGLFLLFLSIKRMFLKKDNADSKKDEIIADLVRSKECAQKRELEFTHDSIANQVEALRKYTKSTNEMLFDKLDDIYLQLKVANGRTGKNEVAIATLRAIHDERHDRRLTDRPGSIGGC